MIVDLGDHPIDAERLVGELRGHDVAIVALGQGDEHVGSLGADATEDVLVRTVAADRLATEGRREAVEGRRDDIQDDDLVSAAVVGLGDGCARPGRIRR